MKKLLDREPTPEMVRAAALYYGISDESLRGIFCYQWDAAPALPEAGEVEQFLNNIAEEYLYLDAPQKEVKARQIRKAADLIAALKAACDKYGDGEDWIQRAMQAEAELQNHLHLDNHNAIVRQLQADNERLRAALEAIKNAPGGGPGKRIAMQALDAAKEGRE